MFSKERMKIYSKTRSMRKNDNKLFIMFKSSRFILDDFCKKIQTTHIAKPNQSLTLFIPPPSFLILKFQAAGPQDSACMGSPVAKNPHIITLAYII